MSPEDLAKLIQRAHRLPWLRSPGSGGAGNWYTIGEAHGDGVDNSVAEARGEANADLIAAFSVVIPPLLALWQAADKRQTGRVLRDTKIEVKGALELQQALHDLAALQVRPNHE